jgi:hypothetical protein
MNDPERLLERPGSLDARLLSAIDEPAPSNLLARTLAGVGAAAVVPATLASSAASSGAKVVAAKVAMGGVFSAVATGVVAGAVMVGVVLSRGESGPRAVARPSPSSVVVPPPVVVTVTPLAMNGVSPSSTAEAPAPRSDEPTARAPAPSSASPKVPRASLATEIALLDEARKALDGGDAAGAKLVMDRYAREAPHGQLAREAALLRAEIARATAPTNR